MKIKQLSIFLENRVGVITEVTSLLSSCGINMRAFSVAEGFDFGILRLIVDDVEAAKQTLEGANIKVNITDVICINVPNVAGGLSAGLNYLAREEIFIHYMYAFSEGDAASTIIRPTDVDRCVEVLERCREELNTQSALYRY